MTKGKRKVKGKAESLGDSLSNTHPDPSSMDFWTRKYQTTDSS